MRLTKVYTQGGRPPVKGWVVIGTRVQLQNESAGAKESFSILGPWDVDLDRGVISYHSPVGRGLLGRKIGDTVEIELPDGSVSYRVTGIEPAGELISTEPA